MPAWHVQYNCLRDFLFDSFLNEVFFLFLVFPNKLNRIMNRRHVYFGIRILSVFRQGPELFSSYSYFLIS